MKVDSNTYQAYKLMHDGVLALARAEEQGLRLDLDALERKKQFLTNKIERLENEFKESSFFRKWQKSSSKRINIYSGDQLATYLYEVKGIKIEKETDSGKGSTDNDAITQMNIPELNDLLRAKKLMKVRDTYLAEFEREQVDGYIHPFFNLHIARTYRSSSNSPNFQNIPIRDEESMKICRGVLYPRPGHQLLEIDFKGIEVAINACYNKDKTLIKYVSNPASDMHADMAKQIFIVDKFDKKIPEHYILRQAAKNGFVFAQFYGDYYKNCAVNVLCNWGKLGQGKFKPGEGIPMPQGTLSDHLISKGIKEFGESKKVGGKYITTGFLKHLQDIETDFWGSRFPEYAEWKESWYLDYRKKGYIDLLTGFRCSGVMSKNQVINTPGQGTAFHCLLWSLIEADRIMLLQKWDTKIVSQIHDSIILDVHPEELQHVAKWLNNITTHRLAQHYPWIIVPMQVDYDYCEVDEPWSKKKKFTLNA